MNQNGFESDEEEQYYKEIHDKEIAEQQMQEDVFNDAIYNFECAVNILGYDTAISYIKYMKEQNEKH